MNESELADAVKSVYIDNPLAPTEFLMAIEATLRGQQTEIEMLKAVKLEYAEEVLEALNWGSYAGDYFQQKHGWHENVAKWNDIISILRKESEK